MSNIRQAFFVEMQLTNCEGQSVDNFADSFLDACKWDSNLQRHVYPYQGNVWELCTFSYHLICMRPFASEESAQRAEADGFGILSMYGYFTEED